MPLNPQDFTTLVRILGEWSGWRNERDRQDFLDESLHPSPRADDIAGQLDLSGNPHNAAVRTIRRLDQFGQDTSNRELACLLIDILKRKVGQSENAELEAISRRLNCPTPSENYDASLKHELNEQATEFEPVPRNPTIPDSGDARLDNKGKGKTLKEKIPAIKQEGCLTTPIVSLLLIPFFIAILAALCQTWPDILRLLAGSTAIPTISSLPVPAEPTETLIVDGRVLDHVQSLAPFTITAPSAGEQLASHEVDVEGTFNPEILEDDVLWLFYVPSSGGNYYPAAEICNPAERNSMDLRPHSDGSGNWRVRAYLGSPDDGGGVYELILMRGSQEANDTLNQALQGWCTEAMYPGFSREELTQMGFTEVAYVEGLTR